MKKVKRFFETPLKAVISILCILAVLALLGTVTVFAASAIAENGAIGVENARNFAFADAGIDPLSAQVVRTEFDFEQGQFVYEVEFTANGTEYEYWIKASDGSVVKKELEIVGVDGTVTSPSAEITADQAKEVALNDAGLAASDVTFTKAKLDREGRIYVYELSFYTADAKFEYEVNASTGDIYSKSRENLVPIEQKPAADSESGASGDEILPESAKSIALADAGVSASDATFTKAKRDYDDGVSVYEIEFYTATHRYDYEIRTDTGEIVGKEVKAFQTETGSGEGDPISDSKYIGVDSAKSVALAHAGLTASSVTFSKAKLDNEDGLVVYEVEFYYNGMEYEYAVDALSGSILEYDCERD